MRGRLHLANGLGVSERTVRSHLKELDQDLRDVGAAVFSRTGVGFWLEVTDGEALEELLLAQEEIPVCGWLVCISGPRQGKDYKIRSGKNFIGRADDMDIQILGDNKISRRNHGVVVFDPKKRQTVLLPGDSNGLVYHNEAAVYTPTVLDSYDVIEMGDSRFVFVPFCGDNFMWEERGQGV